MAELAGLTPPTPVYPEDCASVERITYKLEWWRLHHQHILLEDGTTMIQYGYTYRVVNIIVLYVKYEEVDLVLDETGYWEGAPKVEPMLPGTNFGYYKISGQYLDAYSES